MPVAVSSRGTQTLPEALAITPTLPAAALTARACTYGCCAGACAGAKTATPARPGPPAGVLLRELQNLCMLHWLRSCAIY